jgi:hypothetical protein
MCGNVSSAGAAVFMKLHLEKAKKHLKTRSTGNYQEEICLEVYALLNIACQYDTKSEAV